MSAERVTGRVEVCPGDLMANGHSGLARTICRELGFRYDDNGCGLRDMRYRMVELVEGGIRVILRVSGIPEVVHPDSDDACPEDGPDEPNLHGVTVDDVTFAVVDRIDGADAAQARINVLEDTLKALRTGMRDAVATLYDLCPEDLDR